MGQDIEGKRSERYPGTIPGENAVALLLRGESHRFRKQLRPHPLLVFQQLVGPMGKIRFSNHHTQLWKNRGKQEVKTGSRVCLLYR